MDAQEASKSYVEQMDNNVQKKMMDEQESVIKVLKEENSILKTQIDDYQNKLNKADVEGAVNEALGKQRELNKQ